LTFISNFDTLILARERTNMKNLSSEELRTVLSNLGACQEAKDWCEGKTSNQAWEQCQRGDWMIWVEGKLWNFNSVQ
jgi:hypothetical protein